MTSLWGGRFSGKLDKAAFDLNSSLPFDQRLARQDVQGSVAWAAALSEAGVLAEESSRIIAGLEAVGAEFERGSFIFADSDEDIHTAVERRLGELIGPLAGKLHTGRSRNDQVTTDFRLWMLDTLPVLDGAIQGFQSTLVTMAETHLRTLMPGYTHLQRAQPVTLAHWLLSHFWPAPHFLSTGLRWPGRWASTRPQRTAWMPSLTGILRLSISSAPPWLAYI